MIPLAVPNISGREGDYLRQCVDSTFVSSVGAFVDRFEEAVAAAAGAPVAAATCSGTAGLHVALVAAGVPRESLVIMPSFTFIATANAVHWAGARPWLLDVSPDSWTLDPVALRRVLTEETQVVHGRRVRKECGRPVTAIMPVYTLGMPADMDRIAAIANEFGLSVIADAAAALGATYEGRPLADLEADLSVFSFNGNKTVTAGGGGAVIGRPDLVARVRHLSTTARVPPDYDHDEPGFNYRMTNLEAAVGLAQMERLEEFVAAKRRIQAAYLEGLAEFPDLVEAPPAPPWAEGACWLAGVVLKAGAASAIEALRAALRERAIDARPFWKPIHLQRPYADAPRGDLSVTSSVWWRFLTLPCSTNITDDELTQVVAAMADLLGEMRKGGL